MVFLWPWERVPFHCSEIPQKRQEYVECQGSKDIKTFERKLPRNILRAQKEQIHDGHSSKSLVVRQSCKICPMPDSLINTAEEVGKQYGYRLVDFKINHDWINYHEYIVSYKPKNE